MIRTGLTDPIRIDGRHLLSGTPGLTFCPGKKGSSVNGPHWERDLETDPDVIVAWGADLVVTLMERHEFGLLGVSGLANKIANRRVRGGTVETRRQEAFVLGYHPQSRDQDNQRPEVSK